MFNLRQASGSDLADLQVFLKQSPRMDSNRRPPPCHGDSSFGGGMEETRLSPWLLQLRGFVLLSHLLLAFPEQPWEDSNLSPKPVPKIARTRLEASAAFV